MGLNWKKKTRITLKNSIKLGIKVVFKLITYYYLIMYLTLIKNKIILVLFNSLI